MFIILGINTIEGKTNVSLAKEIQNIEVEEIPKEEIIEYTLNDEFKDNWYIEIPKIKLVAPIAEGTTGEVMNKYVGHFENTNVWEGNIGLAAHNRRISSKLFWKN